MGSRSRGIFATHADLTTLFSAIERHVDINYVLTEASDHPIPRVYRTYSEIPDFGISKTGIAGVQPYYLVVLAGTEIAMEEILVRKVGLRYFIFQNTNPASIGFRTGGFFGSDWLVCGDIGTISDDPISSMLYRTFAREIKKTFKYIGSFWVGPEALQLYRNGVHFTDDIRSGNEFRFDKL